MSPLFRVCVIPIFLSMVLFATASRAEPSLPEGWMAYPTPKHGACEWQRANYSRQEWSVLRENNRLVIMSNVDGPRPPSKTPDAPKFEIPGVKLGGEQDRGGQPCRDCVLRVDNGWLVGFNHGEWAGRLWWTDTSGRNAYPIADIGKNCDGTPTTPDSRMYEFALTNIVSLQVAGARILAFSGLEHLNWTIGEISRVEKRDGAWKTCRLKDLGEVPYAVVPDAATWLVLSQHGLVRAHAEGALQSLGHFSFLDEGLYPNSMAQMPDGTLYVGMRHFVARLLKDGSTYRDQLLLHANRPPFVAEPLIDGPDGFLHAGCKRLK